MMFLLTGLSWARPHLETLIGYGRTVLSSSVLCKPEGNAASSGDQGSSLSFSALLPLYRTAAGCSQSVLHVSYTRIGCGGKSGARKRSSTSSGLQEPLYLQVQQAAGGPALFVVSSGALRHPSTSTQMLSLNFDETQVTHLHTRGVKLPRARAAGRAHSARAQPAEVHGPACMQHD
jgi:hypothetical protein